MLGSRLTSNDNVKVVVRVRPPLTREIKGELFISNVEILPDQKRIRLLEYYNLDNQDNEHIDEYINDPKNYVVHEYTFDHVYD